MKKTNNKTLHITLEVKNLKVAQLFEEINININSLNEKYNSVNKELDKKLNIVEFNVEKQLILDKIKTLETLITADEETIKKIKDIINDLENVETGFLTRLTKIENVKFGLETMFWQFKDIDKISFNDLDFEIIFNGEVPNKIIKISLKDTIARKSDIPDISKLVTKDELAKATDLIGQYSEFLIDKGGILFSNFCQIDAEIKKIKLANADIIDIPIKTDEMKNIPYIFVGNNTELIVDWNFSTKIDKVKAKGISRNDKDNTKEYIINDDKLFAKINKFKLQEYVTKNVDEVNWENGSRTVEFIYLAEEPFLDIMIKFLYT